MNTGTETTANAWIPKPITITTTINDESFASRLRLVRHQMGWNLKEAARECGLPPATWRLWEVEGALPRNIVTIAIAIASRTGCDDVWLVHGPRRGVVPTTGYAPGERVIARIGSPERETRPAIHRGLATRPVRQTRPLRQMSRPLTPTAV